MKLPFIAKSSVRIRGWNSFQKRILAIEIDDNVANVQHIHAEDL